MFRCHLHHLHQHFDVLIHVNRRLLVQANPVLPVALVFRIPVGAVSGPDGDGSFSAAAGEARALLLRCGVRGGVRA